jgi:signal transduction histidine kinase
MNSQSAASGRLAPRLVIASIAGLWLCYFLLVTLRGAVMGFSLDWPMLSRRIAVTALSMAATALLWPVLYGLYRRSLWVKAAAAMLAALPVAMLLAGINAWVFADIQTQTYSQMAKSKHINIRRDQAGNLLVDVADEAKLPSSPAFPNKPSQSSAAPGSASSVIMISAHDEDETFWQQMTELALGRYFLLLAWAALYLALAYAEQARAAERREGEFRRAAKAAELRSLRYQINPHFLFNTLNSLSALVVTGRTDRAERMIQTLSNFYRASLAEDPMLDHSLAEEVDQQQRYLEIEGVRFPDRLKVHFVIPADLAAAQVPGMILQPLIENSVKYAVASSKRAVTISVEAREEAGRLVLTVADDGPGTGMAGSGGFGIGLSNVRDRLQARFGRLAVVTSGSAPGGYRTVLRLPLVMRDG